MEVFHITWSTYYSRSNCYTPDNPFVEPVILDINQRNEICRYLNEKITEQKYLIVALNVLDDHVHCIPLCNRQELPELVRQLKGYSSRMFHKDLAHKSEAGSLEAGLNPPLTGTFHQKLWAKKYSCSFIDNKEQLIKKFWYVNNNHNKHSLERVDYALQYSNRISPNDAIELIGL